MLKNSIKSGALRLLELQEKNDKMGVEMLTHTHRMDALRKGSSRPQVITTHQLFQTPEDIAAEMVNFATERYKEKNGGTPRTWLEPSAGLGRIANEIKKQQPGFLQLVEISVDCAKILYDRGFSAIHVGDFLAWEPQREPQRFDCIIMNPPFTRGSDVKHIAKARSLLAPGGVLVSLCYDGASQRGLVASADYCKKLPDGSFRESGTNAGVWMVVFYG